MLHILVNFYIIMKFSYKYFLYELYNICKYFIRVYTHSYRGECSKYNINLYIYVDLLLKTLYCIYIYILFLRKCAL